MARLIFEKKGRSVWISHLDLMRLFQRAFKRAELPLKHTQGFNPRPSVSIALPLSVGVESRCELLEFEIDGEMPPLAEMRKRLNDALVEGVRVLQIYEGGRKLRDLALLDCTVMMEYDTGVTQEQVDAVQALFGRETLIVAKKTKNGPTDQDLIPMIQRLEISTEDRMIRMNCLVCCQNPTLNPAQLVAAVEKYLPDLRPDHVRYCRNEIFTQNEKVFR